MRPSISILTLGVADLDRALEFYRDGLGLATPGIVGREFAHGAVAFFDLAGGLKLALWARADMAHDTGLELTPGSGSVSIAHNVARPEEVDRILDAARAAGAAIVQPARPTFYGGHAGYFTDPDGHLWEIAWNPDLMPPA